MTHINPEELLAAFRAGSRRALARIISLVENNHPAADRIRDALYPDVGGAYRIGLTGPPGAGKSTIANQLVKAYLRDGKTVGIVAVDPTSPFTGGALLGDRVRMHDLTLEKGVFIRSMATRGSLGGLAAKAQEVADVMDAFGKDFIIFETVGVGQSELDIAGAADTTLVTLVPESGDAIQAMKAGLMEIADIFIMNKADREGADRAMRELDAILHLRNEKDWHPPIIKTIAVQNQGIGDICDAIQQHRAYLEQSGGLTEKRQERFAGAVKALVMQKLKEDFWDEEARRILAGHLAEMNAKTTSPFRAARQLLERYENNRAGE